MRVGYWEQVVAADFAVPADTPLADLTAELTVMLGSPDPHVREELALAVVGTWLRAGVYDDLARGLGDGMVAGLRVGLGEDGTDTVFRRASSAVVLAACLERDTQAALVSREQVLRWGDAVLGWLVREQDLRGWVPGRGRAQAVSRGADALTALAGSAALGETELVALLDVAGDRVAAPTQHRLVDGEEDRLARTVLAVLRRDLVAVEVLEGLLDRLVTLSEERDGDGRPPATAPHAQALLRAVHLQLAVGADPPALRHDALLAVLAALRRSNRGLD